MTIKKIILAILVLVFQNSGFACTVFTFNYNSARYIARSYDWSYSDGVVLANPSGVSKISLLFDMQLTPAKWISKFGSVTFNQAADEFPMSGMNEAGLTVDILILSKSEFPHQFTKPVLNEVQFVQYLLDTAATVDEAKSQAEKIQISPFAQKVHYMVCDAKSECAAFEYLDGELIVSKYKPEHMQILANDLFSETLDPLKMSTRPKAAYDHLKNAPVELNPVGFMMDGLQKVKLPISVWQIVYNVFKGQISFRNVVDNKLLKLIDLKKMDFSCSTVKKYIDINSTLEGDISTRLENYPQSRNESLLKQVLPDSGLIPYINQFYSKLSCP